MDEDVLIHYGVLGMKWGVRKEKRSADKRAVGERKKAVANAKNKESSAKRKNKVKYQIDKHGGKENAISAIDRKSKAKQLTKKGAAYTASLLASVNSIGYASIGGELNALLAAGVIKSGSAVGMLGAIPAASTLPVAAILAGVGVGAAVVGSKIKKNKKSKKDQQKIKDIKNYK